MKNLLVALVLVLTVCISTAQVGIGTTLPNAALDISNTTDGGVLIPKYSLTGNNDIATVVNPQPLGVLETGTLIYNTNNVTGVNKITEGFVYWNGTTWTRIVPSTGVWLSKFNSTTGGVGGSGSVFNFSDVVFNNIDGATYNSSLNRINLPLGTYVINSNLRLNSNNSIDWSIRQNGTEITGSVRGSTSPPRQNTNASEVELTAIFEITANNQYVDFAIVGGTGASVIPGQCYVKIEKIN